MFNRFVPVLWLLFATGLPVHADPGLVGMWAAGAGQFAPARIDRVHFALRLGQDGSMTLWRRLRYEDEGGTRRSAITEYTGVYSVKNDRLTLVDERGNMMESIVFALAGDDLTLTDRKQTFTLQRVF